MAQILENQLFAAAQVIEQQLDQEFDRLDNLDTEDLKALREKRIQEMKKLNNKKQEWLRNVSCVLAVSRNWICTPSFI